MLLCFDINFPELWAQLDLCVLLLPKVGCACCACCAIAQAPGKLCGRVWMVCMHRRGGLILL